jgi:ferrochelatase
MKTAVVLLNLGGPSHESAIKPFLFNFFMDPNIIALPQPFRWMIAKWISFKRGNGAAKEAYAPLGGRSPLLENTLDQAAALERALEEKFPDVNDDVRVFVCMRYWHPMADAVVREVKAFGADRVILLPLYPQFSTTTTFSAFQAWEKAAAQNGLTARTEKITCYPVNAGFIQASAENIRAQLDKAPKGTRVLFSAHGLPEKIIIDGDPYQWECEQSAEAIVKALNMPDLDWQICYQSRVGPLKWIGPSTEEAMHKAAADKVGVIIYPHAFVSEHVETLVEIDMEYRHKAEEMGIPFFAKAETVGTHPAFIKALADLVMTGQPPRICPKKFTKCVCQ